MLLTKCGSWKVLRSQVVTELTDCGTYKFYPSHEKPESRPIYARK